MLSSNPAQNLMRKGRVGGKWRLVRKAPKLLGTTGGHFSVGYVVEDESGRPGFLKALDFSEALKQPNPTIVLQGLTNAFNYEKQLLDQCRANNLDRVAVSVDDGEITVGDLHPILPVPYIIFELADGDVRSRLNLAKRFELSFILRALHHCTTGIRQLHNLRVAHQDLKPSNVLVFDDTECRVGDLGRSAMQGSSTPMDQADIAGDITYAPPELLYGEVSSDWRVRRLACDLYHIGSMAVFFFAKVGMTAMWHKHLDRSFWPRNWNDSYRSALPYVRNAHDFCFSEFERQIHQRIRGRLGEAIRQLCEPDPLLRGHPIDRARRGTSYSLERYVARFDHLARVAEWEMKRMSV